MVLFEGSPAPDVVVACMSGSGVPAARAKVEAWLHTTFPHATVRVLPDYAAAYAAIDPPPAAVVIAGTGSVVASPDASGAWVASGGLGWPFGDEGSATLLGQRLIRRLLNEDPQLEEALIRAVFDLHEVDSRAGLLNALRSGDNPGPLFAHSASLLTRSAEEGDAWAQLEVDESMAVLALTISHHLHRHGQGAASPQVALIGGVWASSACRMALRRHVPNHVELLDRHRTQPIDGAVRLAKELSHGL